MLLFKKILWNQIVCVLPVISHQIF